VSRRLRTKYARFRWGYDFSRGKNPKKGKGGGNYSAEGIVVAGTAEDNPPFKRDLAKRKREKCP